MAKLSPLFSNFIEAALIVIGLLAVMALFGEWGLIAGLIIVIVIVLANTINSYRHKKRPGSKSEQDVK